MCCYLSSPAEDGRDEAAEISRASAADSAVYAALVGVQLALIVQSTLGVAISSGKTGDGLDQRIVEADRAVIEALDRYNVALCSQARGEPYRLLEASHGGVARSMRARLLQNRRMAAVEAHHARQAVADARVA